MISGFGDVLSLVHSHSMRIPFHKSLLASILKPNFLSEVPFIVRPIAVLSGKESDIPEVIWTENIVYIFIEHFYD
jgi:hypothetical protein